MHITYIVYTKKGRKIMGLGFSLEDLFDMSQVEEGDEPVFFSKTGSLNFSARNALHRGKAYKYGDTGVAYSEDGKTLLHCPESRPGTVRIHEGVEGIGDFAFQYGALSAIVLPDSIHTIGIHAFSSSDITQITFGNGISNLGDEDNNTSIFSDCACLTKVVFPENITSIGSDIFCGCVNLRTVVFPNTMTKIGNYAFYNCALENTVIPKSIKSIGTGAFCGAESLIFEKIPKNIISSIVASTDDYDNVDSYRCNYVKITCNGNTVFIPRLIAEGKFNDLVKGFDETWFNSEKGYCLFNYGATSEIKGDTAFAEFQQRKTRAAFDYLHKCGDEMSKRYLLKKRQDEFVDLLATDAIDKKLLPELLDIANKNEKTIAAAYIMQCMGNVPDDVYDDTYDL